MNHRLILPSVGLLLGASLTSGCSSCFGGSTLVRTRRGQRRIESLKPGDEVLSFDTEGGLCFQAVVRTYRHKKTPVFRLGDSGLTRVTANHPIFRVSTSDFVRADGLLEGDAVLSFTQGTLSSKMLSATATPSYVGDEEVFNLEVEGPHTYFADGVLVHNKSYSPPEERCEQAATCDAPPSSGEDTIDLDGTGGEYPSGGSGSTTSQDSPGGAGGLGGAETN